jgi:hypothetical protein
VRSLVARTPLLVTTFPLIQLAQIARCADLIGHPISHLKEAKHQGLLQRAGGPRARRVASCTNAFAIVGRVRLGAAPRPRPHHLFIACIRCCATSQFRLTPGSVGRHHVGVSLPVLAPVRRKALGSFLSAKTSLLLATWGCAMG